MKKNLEVLFQNLLAIPDRFKLSDDEQKLLDAISRANKPSDIKISSEDVVVLKAIDRRSKITDDDRKSLEKIKENVYRTKAVKTKKSFVI